MTERDRAREDQLAREEQNRRLLEALESIGSEDETEQIVERALGTRADQLLEEDSLAESVESVVNDRRKEGGKEAGRFHFQKRKNSESGWHRLPRFHRRKEDKVTKKRGFTSL